MYAHNALWAEEYAQKCAECHNTEVAGIEQMEN